MNKSGSDKLSRSNHYYAGSGGTSHKSDRKTRNLKNLSESGSTKSSADYSPYQVDKQMIMIPVF